MRKLFILFLIFVYGNIEAQEFKIDSTKYERFKIEYGMLIPLGNLKEKFETSHEIGFWYRTRIAHNDLLDIGFNLNLPSSPKRFNYYGKDSIFRVKTKGLNGMFGFRMNKLYKLNQNIALEWRSSIGYHFFIFDDLENRLYDKKNPPSQAEIDKQIEEDRKNNVIRTKNTYSKALSSLYLGQGFTLNYKQIGLQCNYNFTPYNWFSKKIDGHFGNSSLSISTFYKF
ncbi:hypothetical protein [Flavobacterium sp.]|uniref:hypothetical protein n=1 Tax=Flavobacterium sp. TaxID=239 RepID=UPI00286E7364|nr:hypothetical protein [Flavobacterium sp.]